MKIGIGNDHAAVEMKFEIADYLKELGYEVVNYGTDKKESCNYPEYGEAVARAVASKEVDPVSYTHLHPEYFDEMQTELEEYRGNAE